MSDQKSSAGEPMSDVTREGKMDDLTKMSHEEFVEHLFSTGWGLKTHPELRAEALRRLAAPSVPVETSTGQPESNLARVAGVIANATHNTDPLYRKPEAAPLSGEGGGAPYNVQFWRLD